MILIGYRLVFEYACAMLNISINPDVDYVENDDARNELENALASSVKNTKLTIFELPDGTYYLGLLPDICRQALPSVMHAHNLSDSIAMLAIEFHQELKKVGMFKYMNGSATYLQEPCAIQCDLI